MSQPVNGTADPSATPEAIAKVLEHVHQFKKKKKKRRRAEKRQTAAPGHIKTRKDS